MARARTTCQFINGCPTLKIEGELRLSTLYSLYLLVRGCAERKCDVVVVDINDDVIISNEVESLSKEELGWTPNNVRLLVTGSQKQARKLQEILGPEHKIEYFSSPGEAVGM